MIRNKGFSRPVTLAAACVITAAAAAALLYGAGACLLILVTGACCIALFGVYTAGRYRELDRMNDYLSGVLAGRDLPELTDQDEGELSILKNNIYKTTSVLRNQKELLASDKIRLAEAMADISHQLKTPLTSMMVMNDLLESEDDPERCRQFLTTQSAQLDRMDWLIRTLLKLSRLDAGTVDLKREEVPAAELVAESLAPFEIQMELAGITVKKETEDMTILCDRNWTSEALRNVVKNCIEHMGSDGILQISTEETNIYRQISISDNGVGIPEEDLPHIFERFYRGSNAGSDSVGIGLALSGSIMENQKGEILAASREGEGTRFDFRFYKTII